MENQVEETGTERLSRLREEAKEYDIKGTMTADQFEAAIAEAKEPGPTGLTTEEARKIEARLKYEFEIQEKFKAERQKTIDRATIVAESESLNIPIDLPENPTELELAKARQLLGIKKIEVKPSPETLGIEAGKKGYYMFTNREQDDAAHTVNLGGKYIIHLIPDQVHVLTDYHIKTWRRIAVVPVYERAPTGSTVEGQMGEQCVRTGGKPRFAFEKLDDTLGDPPAEAPFGLVTDKKILDKLKPHKE